MDSLLEKGKRFFVLKILGVVLLTCTVGLADYITGGKLQLEAFYLVPVGLATLYLGRWPGIAIVILSAVSVLSGDIAMNLSNLNLVVAWNFIENLLVFSAFTVVLTVLNMQIEKQNSLVREDPLTGIGNRKLFMEMAEQEMNRLRRYKRPFTAAFVNVINLGEVNQQLGNEEGDFLLVYVAKTIRNTIRTSDIAARLGNNEFAILFPETGADASTPLIEKIKKMLSEISENQKNSYEIVFSAACVTFLEAPASVNDIFVKMTELMIGRGAQEKNSVAYDTYKLPAKK